MTYAQLIYMIHSRTWVDEAKVRLVLETLADVLRANSSDGEYTRTPLGVFYLHVRQGYPLALPDGSPGYVPDKKWIKLKPGARLTQGWVRGYRPANLGKLLAKKKVYNPTKQYLEEDDEGEED